MLNHQNPGLFDRTLLPQSPSKSCHSSTSTTRDNRRARSTVHRLGMELHFLQRLNTRLVKQPSAPTITLLRLRAQHSRLTIYLFIAHISTELRSLPSAGEWTGTAKETGIEAIEGVCRMKYGRRQTGFTAGN